MDVFLGCFVLRAASLSTEQTDEKKEIADKIADRYHEDHFLECVYIQRKEKVHVTRELFNKTIRSLVWHKIEPINEIDLGNRVLE